MGQNHLLSVRNVTVMAMFGALATVLIIFEIPLPFIAPSFYDMDINEVPVLVGILTLGPMAGVVMELMEILVKLILEPINTGFVEEFASSCVGCFLALPVGFIYRLNRTKKEAIIGMAAETVIMAIVAMILNAVIMLPFYSHFMLLDTIIAAGAATNPAISNVWTPVILAVGPFNMPRDVIVSLFTALVYKRVSVTIHSDPERRTVKTS